MKLSQMSHRQVREFELKFQPGELEDQRSGFAGVDFQPTGGTVSFLRYDDGPWQLGDLRVDGPTRRKNGSLGTRLANTRFFHESDTPEPLWQAVQDTLAELNRA